MKLDESQAIKREQEGGGFFLVCLVIFIIISRLSKISLCTEGLKICKKTDGGSS
jgi:hypothetical protein